MGGLITALSYARKAIPAKVSGMALCAPALGLKNKPSPWLRTMARAAERWFPKVAFSHFVKFSDIVHDPETIEQYKKDPYHHQKITPPLYFGLLNGCEEALQKVSQFHLPLLIQLAGKEALVDNSATRGFFRQAPSENKKMVCYNNSLHGIYDDLEKDAAYADLFNFLKQF